MIIFVTSRKSEEKKRLETFLFRHRIRFNHIIYDAPFGERILINDNKPSGLKMAYSLNKARDENCNITININKKL